jgi:hypothetical protein
MTKTFDRYTPLDELMPVVARKNSDFSASLCRQYDMRGSLSLKQHDCAISMANDVLATEARREGAGRAAVTDVSKTFSLLEGANIRLARFMIDGHEIRLKRNKPGTSYYALMGDSHLGSVTADGEFRVGSAYRFGDNLPLRPQQVAKGLKNFGEDPIAVMAKYGLETGICGVCGRALTDADSVARGIGPTCSKRLGGL